MQPHKTVLFADDTKFLCNKKYNDDLSTSSKKILERATDWLVYNNLKLNNDQPQQLFICNITNEKNGEKLLGISLHIIN